MDDIFKSILINSNLDLEEDAASIDTEKKLEHIYKTCVDLKKAYSNSGITLAQNMSLEGIASTDKLMTKLCKKFIKVVDKSMYSQASIEIAKDEFESLKKEYNDHKLILLACNKAITCYETNLDVKLKIRSINEGETNAILLLENEGDYPIFITFDEEYKIKKFNATSVLSNKEHTELEKWFTGNSDPTSLIIKIRNFILNKVEINVLKSN